MPKICVNIILLLALQFSHGKDWNEYSTDDLIPENWCIDTNLDYSKHILSWQRGVVDKSYYIIDSYRQGALEVGKLYLSGHASFSYYAENTNTSGKFPLLGRFPSQHSSGKSGDEQTIDNLDVAITYAPTNWINVFLHGIYTELEFPGQEEKQIREAFVTLGDLNRFPFYVTFGRKTVDFGNMQSYNPTTHSVTNHYYRVDSDDAVLELGYVQNNFRLALTGIAGGRQLRVADLPESGFLKNFAVSATYDFPEYYGWQVDAGAGYIYNTIYDSNNANHPGVNSQPFLEQHRNGAYDVWLEAKYGNLSLMGEFTQTERGWPATGAAVRAITVQAAYDFNLYDMPSRLSVVYGHGKQGGNGDEYESLQQLAAGLETFITPNLAISAEYLYNKSFVPLIMITRASDQSVEAHTLALSGRLFF